MLRQQKGFSHFSSFFFYCKYTLNSFSNTLPQHFMPMKSAGTFQYENPYSNRLRSREALPWHLKSASTCTESYLNAEARAPTQLGWINPTGIWGSKTRATRIIKSDAYRTKDAYQTSHDPTVQREGKKWQTHLNHGGPSLSSLLVCWATGTMGAWANSGCRLLPRYKY